MEAMDNGMDAETSIDCRDWSARVADNVNRQKEKVPRIYLYFHEDMFDGQQCRQVGVLGKTRRLEGEKIAAMVEHEDGRESEYTLDIARYVRTKEDALMDKSWTDVAQFINILDESCAIVIMNEMDSTGDPIDISVSSAPASNGVAPAIETFIEEEEEDDDDVENDTEEPPQKKKKRTSLARARQGVNVDGADVGLQSSVAAEGAGLTEHQKPSEPEHVKLNRAVAEFFIGEYNINISDMAMPEQLQTDREVLDSVVDEYVQRIMANPTIVQTDQGFCAIVDATKEEFHNSGGKPTDFSLVQIGGLHRRHAYPKILEEIPDFEKKYKKSLKNVRVSVYSNEMSEELQSRLANLHNANNIGSRATTFGQKVTNLRRWLFAEADGIRLGEIDIYRPTPKPPPSWKPKMKKMFLKEYKGRGNALEPALNLASQPADVFRVTEHLFSITEKNKGTKNASQSVAIALQGLPGSHRLTIVNSCLAALSGSKPKSCSDVVKMLKADCKTMKHRNVVIGAFCRHTGLSSWKELQAKFPQHATIAKMDEIWEDSKGWTNAKETPQNWLTHFEAAVNFDPEEEADETITRKPGDALLMKTDAAKAFLHMGLLEQAKKVTVTASCAEFRKNFPGFDLFVLNIDDLNELTLRRVFNLLMQLKNSSAFNLVLFGNAERLTEAKRIVSGVHMTEFNRAVADIDELLDKRAGYNLRDGTVEFAVANWSHSGNLLPKNGNFTQYNVRRSRIFHSETWLGLAKQLVQIYCPPGGWVLHGPVKTECYLIKSLQYGRNSFGFLNSAKEVADYKRSAMHSDKLRNRFL